MLHGQYLRQTEEVGLLYLASEWRFEKRTESLIVATQNQSIRTNLVKAKINKSQ